jgi:uncharacterized protein YndB with AHSA1/START domain
MAQNTTISKDLAAKKLKVVRHFDAPVDKVWKAWTERELLDKWWAPKPWRAETKTLDFRAGGLWLYAMVGPDGTRMWCRVDLLAVSPRQYFTSRAVFCDEEGNADPSAPPMNWRVQFEATDAGTTIVTEITFDKEADMKKIVEMGFEGGYTMGLGNLEELLAGQ